MVEPGLREGALMWPHFVLGRDCPTPPERAPVPTSSPALGVAPFPIFAYLLSISGVSVCLSVAL